MKKLFATVCLLTTLLVTHTFTLTMSLAQQQTLATYINANPDLSALPNAEEANLTVASLLNTTATPTYWVWRTDVTRSDIYNETSVDGTTWSWQTYKGQTQGEQGAWTQMFMGDRANFAKPNLRAGVSNIFGVGNAQTTHCFAIARRAATRFEKLFAVGNGAAATPSTMALEGNVLGNQVGDARNLQ